MKNDRTGWVLVIQMLTVVIVSSTCIKAQTTQTTASFLNQTLAFPRGQVVSTLGISIDAMVQDRHGDYWFASNGSGIYHFDGKKLLHITEQDGLCSNYVLNIQEDVNGKLWMSTREGVCQFDGQQFTDMTSRIRHAPYGKLTNLKGGLFFAHSDGICFYNGSSFTNFKIHPVEYYSPDNNLARPYGIYAVQVDAAGNAWFGTQAQGIAKYDGQRVTYVRCKHLAGPAVRAVFQDKNGVMWFGNNGGGLFKYDGKKLTNITETFGLGNPDFLRGVQQDKPGSLARVFAINEDKEGQLWIATIDAGVWKYDGKTLTNYTARQGLPGNGVWALYRDGKDVLWIIVDGKTVCRYTGHSFEPFPFKSKR